MKMRSMSTYIKILCSVCLFCLCLPLSAQTDTLNIKKEVEIPAIPDTIPEKQFIGRFNRGIINHLFVKRKTWMTGLTVSYVGYDSEDTQFLSLLKDFDCDAKLLTINPFVGYFIKNNICIGIKVGYQNVHANLGNISIDIDDDLDFSLKNMSFDEHLLSTTVFYRSYVGLDRGKRFGLFNETSLSFNNGSSNYKRGSEENFKDTQTRIREVHVGLNPGATVFIMENISAELSFGVVGFKYREEKQTTNGESSGWRKSSGANFKINLLNISIGIVAYL